MEKVALKIGAVVKSLKGHDTDKIFVVISINDGNFVQIVNGKSRKLKNPKLKRMSHLKELYIDKNDEKLTKECVEIAKKIDNKKLSDADIIHFLKSFKGR